MKSLNEYIAEYQKQLEKGDIKKAYKGLMDYIMDLRIHFKDKYPEYNVSGNIYYGTMDISFFSLSPESLKNKKLKVVVVFIHDKCQFEVWLAGTNKQIQTKYRNLFKENNWNKYRIPPTILGVDYILEYTLAGKPDFRDLGALTEQIESGTLKFMEDINAFLGPVPGKI